MARDPVSIFFFALTLSCAGSIAAQMPAPTSNESIRVTVSLNADGSRTTYQFDNTKHEAIASTTDPEGKPRGKVRYQIGDAGRFVSGIFFGPDGKFLFKTAYKYEASGRLEEETRLTKDDAVINKIVYRYDPSGKQIGYSVFDAAGKLISDNPSAKPSPPSKHRTSPGR
jgi:hypothetical protein